MFGCPVLLLWLFGNNFVSNLLVRGFGDDLLMDEIVFPDVKPVVTKHCTLFLLAK
jgi:hypothetical protein